MHGASVIPDDYGSGAPNNLERELGIGGMLNHPLDER